MIARSLTIAATTLFATPAFAFEVSVVPEPSTLGLLAAGIVGVLAASRLRRRK